MAKKLRVGFIGCGDIAQKKHMEALLYHADKCEMVGFSDSNLVRAEEMRARYGTPDSRAYADYRDMLRDESIDVVHICTPNALHAQNTIESLEAGKHVLCEKPMAHSVEAAQAMVDAAVRTGKKLSISYQYRFREDSRAIKEEVAAGRLGEIYYARAQAVMRRSVPTWGQFLSMEAQGGGPLIDLGTHALDLTLWLMDNYDVESVTGASYNKLGKLPKGLQGNPWGNWDPEKYEVEDSAMAMIRMKNGASVMLEASWALNTTDVRPMVATLCGTLGGAVQEPGPWAPMTYTYAFNRVIGDTLVTERPNDFADYGAGNKRINELMVEAPRKEIGQWLDAILEDREPVVRAEEGLIVCKILNAVYESSKRNKPVYFA